MKIAAIRTVPFAVFIVSAAELTGQACRNPTPVEQAAIQTLAEKDKAASIAGDWESLATLWTDDAIALPPGQQPLVGLEAIRTWLQRDRIDVSKLEVTTYSINVRNTEVCGDTAVQWGTTTITIKPKDAPSGMRAEGNIERVLKRQVDGSWKVQRAIWNMSRPTSETGTQSR